jgi:hypothetical protein
VQAIIILGMVGFIYAGIASIVATVFTGTVDFRQKAVVRVVQMFDDVEFAVTGIILSQDIDLTSPNYVSLVGGLDLSELVSLTPWSYQELIQDPWGNVIQIQADLAPVARSTLYADPTTGSAGAFDNVVVAPIWAFALISPGPNNILDTVVAGGLTYLQILNLEADPGTDDIIHTFSTQKAMLNIWSELYFDIDNKILPAITDVYKQQQEAFQPVIDFAYDELLASAGAGEASTFLTDWQDYGNDRITAILPPFPLFTNADMQAYIGGVPHVGLGGGTYYYPNIGNIGVEHIGLDSLMLTWEPFLITMNAIISDFWLLGTLAGDEQAIAEESEKVHIQLTLPAFGGIGEWDLDFNIVATGAD